MRTFNIGFKVECNELLFISSRASDFTISSHQKRGFIPMICFF